MGRRMGSVGGGAESFFKGPWGSWGKPVQVPTKYVQTDPFVHTKPEQAYMENLIQGSMRRPSPGSSYVGPNAWQTGAIQGLTEMRGEAEPAFRTGLATTGATLGGQYLDPMSQAGFRNVAGERGGIANEVFGSAMAQRGVAENPLYDTPARRAQRAAAAERMGLQSSVDVARAGYEQAAAERKLQEAARDRGLAFAPGVAAQVFKQGEQARMAEQSARAAAITANMRAQGYDQDAINQVLRYVGMKAGQTLDPVTGLPIFTQQQEMIGGAWRGITGGAGAAAGG
jgi:hypothetical protein